ncbi:hypothetical protein FNJ84_13620 [Paracoccus sp. M683]|uniref:hypothetical protein n=1 Tax=Paracoccus sp. M683 TaxID=2594268 RepID=UPI00117F1630|nr:hypothetical protein [Paracoccus sp. M683]TRW96312.1 hypothetical protein FNJ84_13620 [Paracoccus sp. M683]
MRRQFRILGFAGAMVLAMQMVPGATRPGMAQAGTGAPTVQTTRQVQDAQLWQTLRLAEMLPIMRDEALTQADEMAEMLFERGSDAGWRQRVGAIHDPERLEAMLRVAFDQTFADLPDSVGADTLAFFRSPLGQQTIALELDARRAILDQDTEDGAIEAFYQAEAIDSPRLARIMRLIDDADLIEPTIAAALNEALAFSTGFAEGDGYRIPMSDDELLADTWSQEPEIRALIEEWVPAYLMLAYSPMNDQDLDRYLEFATSDSGKVLWTALGDAYEQVYTRTSREMGEAAALHISGRQL